MYLQSYIRLAVFRHAAIVLDLKHSRYLVYANEEADALAALVDGTQRSNTSDAIAHLKSDAVLTDEAYNDDAHSPYDYRAKTFSGFSSSVWARRNFATEHRPAPPRLRDMSVLTYCCLALRMDGVRAVPGLLATGQGGRSRDRQTLDVTGQASQMWNAVLWSPFRVACLEWSLALARKLQHQSVAASVVVGVRPRPFCAHAWVEVGGAVVADEADLRAVYGVIYEG